MTGHLHHRAVHRRHPVLLPLLVAFVAAACSPSAQGTPSPTAAPTGSLTPSATPGDTPGPTPRPTDPTEPTPGPGPTWAELAAKGPAAREDHTWTVDGDGAFAYLFGGRSGSTVYRDLWRYDLDADRWQRLTPSGSAPGARFGHAAVWVDGVGLVVWAGQSGSSFFADLWAYDPGSTAWRKLPSTGAIPEARYGSCAVERDGRMWISHGFTDRGRFSDTRAYDFAADTWTDETPGGDVPVERCLHDCLWASDGRLLLYAGQTNGAPALGDLWAFDPAAATWTELAKPEPPARQLYAAATSGGLAWVFGGAGTKRQKLGDLWTLDLTTLVWRAVAPRGDGPSGRSGAALVGDPVRGRLLLFGGAAEDGELSDLWQLTSAVE